MNLVIGTEGPEFDHSKGHGELINDPELEIIQIFRSKIFKRPFILRIAKCITLDR